MSANINVVCDNCNAELNNSRGVPEYAITLSCNILPFLPNEPVADVYVYPDFKTDKHFCGPACLGSWLTKTSFPIMNDK